jgi:hypothetical protein
MGLCCSIEQVHQTNIESKPLTHLSCKTTITLNSDDKITIESITKNFMKLPTATVNDKIIVNMKITHISFCTTFSIVHCDFTIDNSYSACYDDFIELLFSHIKDVKTIKSETRINGISILTDQDIPKSKNKKTELDIEQIKVNAIRDYIKFQTNSNSKYITNPLIK